MKLFLIFRCFPNLRLYIYIYIHIYREREKERERERDTTICVYRKFRPKSTFNPESKEVIVETYLSSLEEKPLDTDIHKNKFNNLSKDEKECLVLFEKR